MAVYISLGFETGVSEVEVTLEDAENLFIALAAVQFDCSRDFKESIDYDMVGQLVSRELGRCTYRSSKVVKAIVNFYEESFGIRTYADLHNWLKKQSDHAYRQQLAQYKEDEMMKLATERKHACTKTKPVEVSESSSKRLACQVILDVLPHVSTAALFSKEMCQYVNANFLKLTYDDCRRYVGNAVTLCGDRIGKYKPAEDRSIVDIPESHRDEIEHADKMRQDVEYGPRKFWPKQQRLYLADLNKLVRFASFQTLASSECYEWLGERFKYKVYTHEETGKNGGDDFIRRLKKAREHLLHIKVLRDAMNKLDAVDVCRLKRTYKDHYDNVVAIRLEMLELEHRFGRIGGYDGFQRYYDGTYIQDQELLQTRQSEVVIFYEILKEQRLGVEGKPSLRRIIEKLHAEGKLYNVTPDSEFFNNFMVDRIHASIAEKRLVEDYLSRKE